MQRFLGPAAFLASAALQPCPPVSAQSTARVAARVDGAALTRLFQQGSSAFSRGDLTGAHTAFARLITLAPRVAAGHAAYGSVLVAQGNLHEATKELTLARQLDPHELQPTITLAVARSRLGEYDAAVALFRSLPAGTDASFQPPETLAYATALAGTGDRAGAVVLLQETLGKPGVTADLWDALGALQAQAGEYGTAYTSFTKALSLDASLPSAHAHLGSVLMIQNQPEEALLQLRQAQQLGDTEPAVQLELGRALTATGHDAEAILLLRGAVAARPDSLDGQYALALALEAGGQAAEAIPLFAKVVAARPTDSAALTNYGLALVHSGDAKGALALYARAAALDGKSASLHEDTGAAYLQLNDIEHALAQFHEALRIDPESAQLHYDLGLAYKLKDDLGSAVPELQHAEALDPKLPDPPYTLGVIRMQQGDNAAAAGELEHAVALRPENGEAWALLGATRKDAGNLDGAAAALHQAITLQPDQPSPHITLAAVLTAKGDAPDAMAERKLAAALSRTAMSRQRAGFALNSGRSLLKEGQTAQAIVQLTDALTAEPDLKEAHLLLAEALQRQGRPTDALAERKKAEQLAAR